jgi:Domain of unknown function (DUF1996)
VEVALGGNRSVDARKCSKAGAEVFYLSSSAPLLEEEMMEHRESNLTHRQRSNKASLGWLLVCTVGAALFAAMIATQGALAAEPSDGWFQKCGLAKTGPTPSTPGDIFDPMFPTSTQKLFYGATEISKDSTKDSLLAGGTTCRFKNGTELGYPGGSEPPDPSGGNRSAYWVPDLLLSDGATFAGGKQLNAYYRKGASSVNANRIVPFPDGLKMAIKDRESSKTNVDWYCSNLNGEGNNGDMRARPYNCNPNGTYPWVTAHITFPQCGAPGATDSTDHISHVVYPSSSGCPTDYPVAYPRLFITAKYNTSQGSGALLAGGRDPATSFTAYFFEAWKPGRLQFYIDRCIKAGINCNSTPPAG